MFSIGYDIGSSSVKAALVNTRTLDVVSSTQFPKTELEIISHHPGWAEQDPETWWQCVIEVTKELIQTTRVNPMEVKSIGIAYQMHGLVLVDENHDVLRPSIIWCDSRAVEIGKGAFQNLGMEKCLSRLLNSPGNFTASKLKWVKDNEPEIYGRAYKMMLPGDFIAMKMTGHIKTTISGLSEGMLWDFKNHQFADFLLSEYDLDQHLIPDLVESIGHQGNLSDEAAKILGLEPGTIVSYRAGDQPNNAVSLGVFNPNEVAATGGTSGVVYGVLDTYKYDEQSRVNGFAHVNHTRAHPRIGQLLCINGAGIQYAWMNQNISRPGTTYNEMEMLAGSVPVGSDGLRILPFGNGAERVLDNLSPGGRIINLQFNRHQQAHLYRAALEGIAFSFVYGFEVLRSIGLEPTEIRVGNDNLFQSSVFSKTISNLIQCPIKVISTTGAVGAAKAGSLILDEQKNINDLVENQEAVQTYIPDININEYTAAYDLWKSDLDQILSS